MGLVGQGVGEQGEVDLVAVLVCALVGEALDAVQEGLVAVLVAVQEALQGLAAVRWTRTLAPSGTAVKYRVP